MTIKQMIDSLRSKGFQVKAYKRKDGGYLIRSINGVKYSAAKGNEAARQILSSPLSVRRAKQLKAITPTTKKGRKERKQGRPPLPPLPKDIASSIKKVQRQFRKNVSGMGDYITITTRSIRKIIAEEGEARARETLAKAKAYTEGKAYPETIKVLADRIQTQISQQRDSEVQNKLEESRQLLLNHLYDTLEIKVSIIKDAIYYFDEHWKTNGALKEAINMYDKIKACY